MKRASLLAILISFLLIGGTASFSITGTTFTTSGNNLIYSDNPEDFSLNQNDVKYLYETTLGTSYKDVEFYHLIYNEWSNSGACRVGVAVKNSSTTMAAITFKGSSFSADSIGLNIGLINTPGVYKDFLTIGSKTITVPPGQSAIVWSDDFNFTPLYAKFVFGRAQFKASVADGVVMRVFAAGQTLSADRIFAEEQELPFRDEHTFCGEINYSQVNTAVDASSRKTFTICEWPIASNMSEYPEAINFKYGSRNKNSGNYGVINNITINHALGKRIKITPRWVPERSKASIVYSLNGGPWTTGKVLSKGGCWYLSLGKNPMANLKFILPGGNRGNYDITFD